MPYVGDCRFLNEAPKFIASGQVLPWSFVVQIEFHSGPAIDDYIANEVCGFYACDADSEWMVENEDVKVDFEKPIEVYRQNPCDECLYWVIRDVRVTVPKPKPIRFVFKVDLFYGDYEAECHTNATFVHMRREEQYDRGEWS
jgi:hypothetical protein